LGLWIQNVGVRAGSLPSVLIARAASFSDWLPRTDGWSWTSLSGWQDDGHFLEEEELDDLIVQAAADARAPALGFSVFDSDAVYLVGADTNAIRFRVVIGEPADTEAANARAPHEIGEAVRWVRSMHRVPHRRLSYAMSWGANSSSRRRACGFSSHEWVRLDRGEGIETPLWPFVLAHGELPRWGDEPFPSLENLSEIATANLGIRVGAWRAVPVDVPSSLYETASWIAAQAR
jgi:hypothetical protein